MGKVEGIVLYANTVNDPESRSVHPDDTFYIAKRLKDQWHIIEGASSVDQATKARKALMRRAAHAGDLTLPTYYRLFLKGLNEVIYPK